MKNKGFTLVELLYTCNTSYNSTSKCIKDV